MWVRTSYITKYKPNWQVIDWYNHSLLYGHYCNYLLFRGTVEARIIARNNLSNSGKGHSLAYKVGTCCPILSSLSMCISVVLPALSSPRNTSVPLFFHSPMAHRERERLKLDQIACTQQHGDHGNHTWQLQHPWEIIQQFLLTMFIGEVSVMCSWSTEEL